MCLQFALLSRAGVQIESEARPLTGLSWWAAGPRVRFRRGHRRPRRAVEPPFISRSWPELRSESLWHARHITLSRLRSTTGHRFDEVTRPLARHPPVPDPPGSVGRLGPVNRTRPECECITVCARSSLLDDGVFSRIDFPGPELETVGYGINNRGQVAGGYVDVGGTAHGFLY